MMKLSERLIAEPERRRESVHSIANSESTVKVRSLLVVVVIAIIADSLPSRARAQNTRAPHADSSLRSVIARIGAHSGRTVRIATHATGRVEGRAVYLRGDSVFLVSERGARAIEMTDVDSLWVQRGTAALMAGFIAAVPCALYGAVVGEFIATDPDSNGRPGRGAAGLLIGGLVGGVPCGLFGAGVGSFIRRWRLEYPGPAEASLSVS